MARGKMARMREALAAALGAPRPDDGPVAGEAALDVVDLREIEDTFAQIEHDLHRSLLQLVHARLELVMARRAPVAALRESPADHTARVCFADGTTVIAESRPPGRLGHLAVEVLRARHRTLLEEVRLAPTGVEMRFALSGGRRFTAWAVGLDQGD